MHAFTAVDQPIRTSEQRGTGLPRPALRHWALLLCALGAFVALAVGGAPAGAHGAEGVAEIVTAEPTPTGLRLEVGVVYANDNDPAEEATVSATLTSPDGEVVGPVPVPNLRSGLYATEVDLPATDVWTVVATVANPAAEVTSTVQIPSTSTTTTTSSTTTTTSTTTTSTTEPEGSSNDDHEGDEVAAADTTEAASDGEETGEGVAIPLAAVLALVAAGLAIGIAHAEGRRVEAAT